MSNPLEKPLCSLDLYIHHQCCPVYNLPQAMCPLLFQIRNNNIGTLFKPQDDMSSFLPLNILRLESQISQVNILGGLEID